LLEVLAEQQLDHDIELLARRDVLVAVDDRKLGDITAQRSER